MKKETISQEEINQLKIEAVLERHGVMADVDIEKIAEDIAKIFLQPDVSGNEANPKENKKDGEVAVCGNRHGMKTIIDLAGYKRCVYCGGKYKAN